MLSSIYIYFYLPECLGDDWMIDGTLWEQSEHVLQFFVLPLEDQSEEMIADEIVSGLLGFVVALAVELPEIGLALFYLDDVVLE